MDKNQIQETFSLLVEDYEKAKQNIIMRLIAHSNLPKDIVHIPYLDDMEIIFTLILKGDGIASVMVTEPLLKKWGITTEELFKEAKEITPKLLSVTKKSMAETLGQILGGDVEVLDGISEILVLSNTSGYFGAASLLYDGLLKQIANEKESNLLIIPSSVHECLLLPEKMFAKFAKEDIIDIIRSVNDTVVVPDEILSYKAYYYDRETDKIKVA